VGVKTWALEGRRMGKEEGERRNKRKRKKEEEGGRRRKKEGRCTSTSQPRDIVASKDLGFGRKISGQAHAASLVNSGVRARGMLAARKVTIVLI
jgi:hypothetical protein